jgi:hypothetical protein
MVVPLGARAMDLLIVLVEQASKQGRRLENPDRARLAKERAEQVSLRVGAAKCREPMIWLVPSMVGSPKVSQRPISFWRSESSNRRAFGRGKPGEGWRNHRAERKLEQTVARMTNN